MSWQDNYETIKNYIIKVKTPTGSGTGFWVSDNINHTFALIATAAHVIADAHEWNQPIKLNHFKTGQEVLIQHGDRYIDIDYARDTAVLVVARSTVDFLPNAPLPILDKAKFVPVGTEMGWVGFPAVASAELCFFSGRVSTFLTQRDGYLVDGVAINGVSGGPVFTNSGNATPRLIGLISSYIANRATGEALPGLLQVQDVTQVQQTLEKIKSLDEAREIETQKSKAEPDSQ